MEDVEQRVWVEDRSWHLGGDGRTCRMIHCPNEAVAWVYRRRNNYVYGGWSQTRWYYCANHLYGRRIVDDQIELQVAAGSPAAERGFTY